MMQSLPAKDSDYQLLSQILPWLQAAEKYKEVTQVSSPLFRGICMSMGDVVLMQIYVHDKLYKLSRLYS